MEKDRGRLGTPRPRSIVVTKPSMTLQRPASELSGFGMMTSTSSRSRSLTLWIPFGLPSRDDEHDDGPICDAAEERPLFPVRVDHPFFDQPFHLAGLLEADDRGGPGPRRPRGSAHQRGQRSCEGNPAAGGSLLERGLERVPVGRPQAGVADHVELLPDGTAGRLFGLAAARGEQQSERRQYGDRSRRETHLCFY
jgi:hypothetical protein